MKLLASAALAVSLFASAAFAGGVAAQPAAVVVEETANFTAVELSYTTTGVRDSDDLGENWEVAAGIVVFEHRLGAGMSSVTLFGEAGELGGVDYTAAGAEYAWTVANDVSALTFAAEAQYTMPDNSADVWLITPTANLAFAATPNIELYGELGYTWDATNDFDRLGGYSEIGVEFGLTDNLAVTTSVVQPFDTGNTDTYAEIGVALRF